MVAKMNSTVNPQAPAALQKACRCIPELHTLHFSTVTTVWLSAVQQFSFPKHFANTSWLSLARPHSLPIVSKGPLRRTAASSAQRCNFIFNCISIWEEVERWKKLLFSCCWDFMLISLPCLLIQECNNILGADNKLTSEHGTAGPWGKTIKVIVNVPSWLKSVTTRKMILCF